MIRQQEQLVLRLWRDWCRLWPEQYGHDSLRVGPEGYDPVFDVIPSQTYKDFYFEVVRGHPTLKHINAFEIIDIALNQISAPETAVMKATVERSAADSPAPAHLPVRASDHVRVVEVELLSAVDAGVRLTDEADTA